MFIYLFIYLKVEKEAPIVHQNIKNIWTVQKQPTHPRIFMWKKFLTKRGLEPQTSRMRGEYQLSYQLAHRDIPGETIYLQWYRGHGTQNKHI